MDDSPQPGEPADATAPRPPPSGRARGARLWRLVRAAFSAVVAAVLVVVVVHSVANLSSVTLRVDPVWLALGWPLAAAAFPLLALGWARLLAAYGHAIGGPASVRLWSLAQASRYLPTGLAAVASRAVLAARLGVPRRLTVATIVVEGGLVVAWSGLAAGALALGGGHQAVIPVAAAGAMAVVGLPASLAVAGRTRAGDFGFSRPPRARPLAEAVAIVGVNMAVKSVVFLLFARALLPVGPGDTALLVGSVNLAVVAGMVGLTPAGIGVREGVLALLLGPRLGIVDATAVALALRVWDLSVEIPWVGGAAIANRWRPAMPRRE